MIPRPIAAKQTAPSSSATSSESGRSGKATREEQPAEHDDQHRLDQEDDERRDEHREEVGRGGSGVARTRFSTPDSRRTTIVIARPAKHVAATP